MKLLQIGNAALAAFGLAMGIILAVVCVLYLANLGAEPRLGGDLPPLYAATALFLGIGACAGSAFQAHRRHWSGRWWLQALPLVPVAGLALFLAGLRG